MVQSGLHTALHTHPGYQGEPVGEIAELENDRVSLRNDDLAVDRAASFLRTRSPGAQQDEQILHADVVVTVEIGGAVSLGRTRPPIAEQDE